MEKQNAEQGLMPVVADDAVEYGYAGENRHFVRAFSEGATPMLTFTDGLEVSRILAACYKSAETGQTVDPRSRELESFVPAVARGAWRP